MLGAHILDTLSYWTGTAQPQLKISFKMFIMLVVNNCSIFIKMSLKTLSSHSAPTQTHLLILFPPTRFFKTASVRKAARELTPKYLLFACYTDTIRHHHRQDWKYFQAFSNIFNECQIVSSHHECFFPGFWG